MTIILSGRGVLGFAGEACKREKNDFSVIFYRQSRRAMEALQLLLKQLLEWRILRSTTYPNQYPRIALNRRGDRTFRSLCRRSGKPCLFLTFLSLRNDADEAHV